MFESYKGSKVTEEVNTPARPRLREVDTNCAKLCNKKQEGFHSIVQNLLWIMKRARPDMETTIDFYALVLGKETRTTGRN